MGKKATARKGARKKTCARCGQPFKGGKGRTRCPTCRGK